MEWGFRAWTQQTIAPAGKVIDRAPVWMGAADTVGLMGPIDLKVTVPRGFGGQRVVKVVYDGPIKAPIKRGTPIATLVVTVARHARHPYPAGCRGGRRERRLLRPHRQRLPDPSPPEVTGKFITLEGGEGAGKSTQALRLAERLTAAGKKVVTTREPGGTPGAEAVRALLVEGEADRWSAAAEGLPGQRRPRRPHRAPDPPGPRRGEMGDLRPLRRLDARLSGVPARASPTPRSGTCTTSPAPTFGPT